MAKEYLTVDGKLVTIDGELVQVPDTEQLNDIADENGAYATQGLSLTDDIEELIVNGVIDGSPRGVYDNLSALQTAYPNGASGVYLTTDNGHWYYWSGSAWTDGGVYQATDISENIKTKVVVGFNLNSDDVLNNKYINYNNGNVYTFNNFTSIVSRVFDFKILYYNSTSSIPDDSGLAFYDINGTYITGYQRIDTPQILSIPNNAYYVKATVNTIDDLSFKYSVLDLFLSGDRLKMYKDNNLITGSFIHYQNGNIVPLNDNFHYINCIVENVRQIKYTHKVSIPDDRGLAFYDCNNVFIEGHQAISTEQTINVPSNAVYCKASVDYNSQLILLEDCDDINHNISERLPLYNNNPSKFISNKYINYSNGNVIDLLNFHYVECYVKGIRALKYTHKVSIPDDRGLAFYDENGYFISGVQTTAYDQWIVVPNNAVYCKASVDNSNELIYLINISEIIDILNKNNEKNDYNNILSSFNNITCIGDSLTYSQVYTADNNSRQAYQTYPMCLQKRTGTTTVGMATAGYDAVDWWTNYNTSLEQKTNQLAIIYLGTNNGLTDTLSSDAPINTDYSTWSNTNTGSYAKIVAKCQELGMKVLLLKVWATSGSMGVETTNSVITQIGTRFGCAVVDSINLSDMKYHYYPDLSGYNRVHYNDLGYSAFTDELIKKISKLEVNQMKLIIPE